MGAIQKYKKYSKVSSLMNNRFVSMEVASSPYPGWTNINLDLNNGRDNRFLLFDLGLAFLF